MFLLFISLFTLSFIYWAHVYFTSFILKLMTSSSASSSSSWCIISMIHAKLGIFSHFLEIGTSDWHNRHYYAKERVFCRFFQLWLVGKGLNIFPQRNFAYRRPLIHVKTYFLKFGALDWLDILQIMIEILAYFFLTIDNQIIIFAYLFFFSLARLKTWVTWQLSNSS